MKSDWNKLKFCLMLTAALFVSGCSLFSLAPQNIKATPEMSSPSVEGATPEFYSSRPPLSATSPACEKLPEKICVPGLSIKLSGQKLEKYDVTIQYPGFAGTTFSCPQQAAIVDFGDNMAPVICDENGISLISVGLKELTVTIHWEGGSITETLHPDYEIKAPEGQNCEPQCQQGKDEIILPEPTSMEINARTPSASVPTETATDQPSGGFVYYVFVDLSQQSVPEGSIEILPEALVLAPKAVSAGDSDPVESLQAALSAMIADENNAWTAKNLIIREITFREGHAMVALEGEIFGAGDIVLIAARMQFLMTIFANQAVQTAAVTLNGETIGNFGISNSLEARPIEDVFTHAEIETFIQEHGFKP